MFEGNPLYQFIERMQDLYVLASTRDPSSGKQAVVVVINEKDAM